MAASFFSAPFRFLSKFAPLRSSPSTSHDAILVPADNDRLGRSDHDAADTIKDRQMPTISAANKKRKAVDDEIDEPVRKRVMAANGHSDGQGHEEAVNPHVMSYQSGPQISNDRVLMPPPRAHAGHKSKIPQNPLITSITPAIRPSVRDDDDGISLTSLARGRTEDIDESVMEERRRYLASIQLPPGSGVWSQTEKDLFFHLAYRGFEPLLPQSWMLDFGTLPIGVFAHENTTDTPLIHHVRDNQFRAARALRQLFEAGHEARDRSLVSPSAQREKMLEQSIKKYLYWALTDMGLRPKSDPNYIPIHTLTRRRRGRTTLQTLEHVAQKLQRLAVRHHRARNVQPSIELHSLSLSDTNHTRVIEDDDTLPTMIGLVMISSVVAVVTLSPFAQANTQSPSIRQTVSPPFSDQDAQTAPPPSTGEVTDRMRIIAEFDFSLKDQDVWNALGLAVVAMQIRKEALRANSSFVYDDMEMLGSEVGSIAGSRLSVDLESLYEGSTRSVLEDDPDL
ncbi:hypothetical protein PV08_01599 [Exophiala spinifera]|uniref:Uncharacterized protein n=1 Tax=Exophiala spinifera TaxID=91928 RepID=A0A0D2BRL4_9EURO|nr:uncharacterized protein PV08_01599 [Exophiala spinifera]KIW21020.1 hypothetical protein PV08_01599 [Exophiala spinifera]